MDVSAFYQTVATFCFTLLGLWWGVLQLRHDEWVDSLPRRRMAYSVHLAFVIPGVMSLGAQTAGDIKIIWRLVFVAAGVLGIAAAVFLAIATARAGVRLGWFARWGRWLSVLLYVLVVLLAINPTLAGLVSEDVQPLQLEGLLFTAIVFLGVGLAWDFLAEPKQKSTGT
jgi:hypothetical protein